MTRKEIEACILAQQVKKIASNLKSAAAEYGVHFPSVYAQQLQDLANKFLTE